MWDVTLRRVGNLASHHGTKCDQSYQGVLGKETQTDNDGVAYSFEANVILARVDDKKEDGRCLRRS